MDTLDLIYNILVGEKVYEDDDAWHVYDKWGSELSDSGGIMWRANPGALIMWPRLAVAPARAGRRNARFEPYRGEPTTNIQSLHQEDELVTDLILTLVTKGFFDGTA